MRIIIITLILFINRPFIGYSQDCPEFISISYEGDVDKPIPSVVFYSKNFTDTAYESFVDKYEVSSSQLSCIWKFMRESPTQTGFIFLNGNISFRSIQICESSELFRSDLGSVEKIFSQIVDLLGKSHIANKVRSSFNSILLRINGRASKFNVSNLEASGYTTAAQDFGHVMNYFIDKSFKG